MSTKRSRKLASELWQVVRKRTNTVAIRFVYANNLTSEELDQAAAKMLGEHSLEFVRNMEPSLPDLQRRLEFLREIVEFRRALLNLPEIGRVGSVRIYNIAKVIRDKILDSDTDAARNFGSLHRWFRDKDDSLSSSEFVKSIRAPDTFTFDDNRAREIGKNAIKRMFKDVVFEFLMMLAYQGDEDSGIYLNLLDVSNLRRRLQGIRAIRDIRLRPHPNTVDLVASQVLSWLDHKADFLKFLKAR